MSGVYGINEEKLRAVFRKCGGFKYKQTDFKVLKVGKPRPLRGECKTDVYILADSAKGAQEFKLSVKQRNADFLENKINLERAKEIFGANAKQVITAAARNLQSFFSAENLVFFRPEK